MDLVDNHIYSSPERMRDVPNQYDNWDRAKVFVDEYAVNSGVGTGLIYDETRGEQRWISPSLLKNATMDPRFQPAQG